MREGPSLTTLLHRVSECPPIFLDEPRIGYEGRVHVGVIVADLIRLYAGDRGHDVDVTPWLSSDTTQRNRLRLIAVACWLLADDSIHGAVEVPTLLYDLLKDGLDGLAGIVEAGKFVANEERREELVRYCLYRLGLRPAGETDKQAEDRLATLNSVEQRSILRGTDQAQRRAEEIRKALKRKAAQEAAAKVSRE